VALPLRPTVTVGTGAQYPYGRLYDVAQWLSGGFSLVLQLMSNIAASVEKCPTRIEPGLFLGMRR
jgi:hypothetical protein